jgi:3-oxoacyl-[acyl-carrier protein] reductase
MSAGSLAGKTAVVTGASKGIGAAIAKQLAAAGASVVVNYSSSREGADRVVGEIKVANGKAVAIQANVGKQADIERLFTEAKSSFGQVDILVNNAGVYGVAPLGAITAEQFHQHFDLNVLGLILTTQEAVKYFPPEGGAIVNVSSVVASLSPAGMAVYNGTKGAVDAITRTFSRELAGRHIRVNSVNPGLIVTEGTAAAGFVKEGKSALSEGVPGQPDDIASIVVFLASPASKWINGQVHYATGQLI